MNLKDINWKECARDFCKLNNSLEVANVEAAMREAAALVVGCVTEKLSDARKNLEVNRTKRADIAVIEDALKHAGNEIQSSH